MQSGEYMSYSLAHLDRSEISPDDYLGLQDRFPVHFDILWTAENSLPRDDDARFCYCIGSTWEAQRAVGAIEAGAGRLGSGKWHHIKGVNNESH